MFHFKNNQGFASMVEVIITAIIFMIASVGIFSSISQLRPQSAESVDRLEAAYAARDFIQELHGNLTSESWETGDLNIGDYTRSIGSYNISWSVRAVAGIDDVRRMNMTINW